MKKTATRIGVLGLLAAVIVFVGSGPAVLGQQRSADRKAASRETMQESDGPVYLYFADPETGYLSSEARRIQRAADPAVFCEKITEALIAGPKNDLMRTLPGQTALRALYITDDGIAYVDFNGDVSEHHPRGVRSELMSVYSIVNTLILNTDGIRAVKILVNGKEADTLAGHVDIRLPLKAQMLLVR
ncbi:MAG: GerMN domain-containing protein [Desulfobacteraceae bacterium]|nr:GerMN domain-containing protein [Desulfobacteraceae bacterium]